MKTTLLNKNPYIMELPFKIVYFIFAIFTFCNLTFMQPIMSVAVVAVLGFAVLAGIPRLITLKGYLGTPGLFLIIAFLVSFTVSFVLNIKYGYSDNFKGLIWLALHFFLLFACNCNRSEKEYKKEFSFIAVFYLIVFFVMSFVSIIQYAVDYSLEKYFDNYSRLAGVVWGRLWGVYRDPNYASVFATVALILSVYFIRKSKNKAIKILLIINGVIQFLYIALSGSRTGMVALFICVFFYVFMVGIKKNEIRQKRKLANTLTVLLAVLVASAVVFACVQVQKINAEIMEYRYYSNLETPDAPDYEDERQQDIDSDISNRRFDLWKSSTEIFLKNPVFGVSFFNLKQYALAEMPDTYLVNNDHGAFNNMHNMIFNILSGQGAIGIIIFAAFALFAVVYIFKNIFKVNGDDYEYLTVMLICIIASVVSSMFVTDLVYTNSPTSLMFWLFLGYIFHYIKRKKLTESTCK